MNRCKYGPYYCWMIENVCNLEEGYEEHCILFERNEVYVDAC